jgi:iron complex outermembrane receptor protein
LEKGFFLPATPPYTIAGGPDFVSETLNSYEVGWRGQLTKGVSLTTTLYFHDYDHLRSVEPTTPLVQANGVKGKSYGLEWFFDYDVTPRWRLRAGGFVMNEATWLKPGGADLEGTLGEASFPDYQAFLRNNFRLSSKVDLWLSLRRVGEVPANENGNGVVPASTELNAQLSWQARANLRLALVGRNLLDPSHPEIGGVNARREIPRTFGASLWWEY